MAAPITNIKKIELTEEQIAEQKLNDLKDLLADNDQALQHIFTIVSDLNSIGVLEAVTKMLAAKEEIGEEALIKLIKSGV